MYEVWIFDGGDKPLIIRPNLSESEADGLAREAVKDEQGTLWRAEVHHPGRKPVVFYPPSGGR